MQQFLLTDKHSDTIEVGPHFATLIEEDSLNYVFQVVFRVRQSVIINKALTKVVISCSNPNVVIEKNSSVQKLSTVATNKKNVLPQIGKFEIDNILLKHSKQIKAATAKQNSIIATSTVILEPYVNAIAATRLRRGTDPKEIDELYSVTDSLELLKNSSKHQSYSSRVDQVDIKNLNLRLISEDQIHPIQVVNEKDQIGNIENAKMLSIRDYYLTDALASVQKENSYYVPVKKRILKDKISIKTHLYIPKKLVQNNVDIVFEVFKKSTTSNTITLSEIPVERKNKTIDVLKHVNLFRLPLVSPKISLDYDHIQAMQSDTNANYIKIEKKSVNNKGECTHYATILDDVLDFGKFVHVREDVPDNKFDVYRCTSGIMPSTIMNPLASGLVVGKPIVVDSLSLIVSDREGALGVVELTIKYPPKNASQFMITKAQYNGASFERAKVLIPYRDFDGESTIVLDPEAQNDQIYEYSLHYKTDTGEVRKSVSQIYEYKKSRVSSFVNVEIDSPSYGLLNGKNTFRFNIKSNRDYSQEDRLRILLREQNTTTDLTDTVEKLSSNMNDFIYHKVSRVNLKTGTREVFEFLNYDITTNATLGTQYLQDDPINRGNNSISDIDDTVDYRYEIRTFVRNPLSTVKNHVEKVTLPPSATRASPKIYYYRPYKWRQPTTLETGTLPAVDDEGNIVGKKFLDDGDVGVTASYLLAASNKNSVVSSMTAERLDINKVKVVWNTMGESRYDHFVIVKEVNRFRRFLGAVVGREFFDVLGKNDVGTVIYYLIPVNYDFSIGVASRSNSLVIDPEELDFKDQIAEL